MARRSLENNKNKDLKCLEKLDGVKRYDERVGDTLTGFGNEFEHAETQRPMTIEV